MTSPTSPAARPIGAMAALLLMPVVVALLATCGFVAMRWGLAGLAAAQLLVFALPAWLAARLGGLPARAALGLVRPPRRALAGAALLAMSFWYLSAALLAPLIEDLVTERETALLSAQFFGPEPLAVKLLVLALLPAACEEMLVRGAIARGLRARLGLLGAAVLSSAYFALLHGSLARLPITFLLGMVLAVATLRSGSIVPAMLIHAGNNAASVLLVQPQLAGAAQVLSDGAPVVLPLAALATAAGFALVWRSAQPTSG